MPKPPLLIVLARAPLPGTVKTRIAAELGPVPALAAYRSMLTDLTRGLRELEHVEIRGTPDDALEALTPWRHPGWQVRPQGPGDLGNRIARAFDDAFQRGHDRVAVIGSDCPTITAGDIRDAWSALDGNDVVLGPAADGGYWLIALRRPEPDLFRDIPWSTPEVLHHTVDRAARGGRTVARLRVRRDIDSAADWQAHRSGHPSPP